ncbi:MAG: polysaccharide biosynthesis protein [Candidatus Competibacteraceae bacterium]|nr:polysaccharide biosynthesis protein [Candidatus Competibacteraceae bacterium]
MGIEAFGLVGFFVMLQGWLQLLDLGLTPTLSREMSLFRAGVHDAEAAWGRLRSLEWILGGLAVLCVLGFWLGRKWIATDWLNLKTLDAGFVAACVFLMGFSGSLRWLTGLYRAGLIGLERQLWVNSALALFTTLKFIAVIPILAITVSPSLAFFQFQAMVGFVELVVFAWMLYQALPGRSSSILPCLMALRIMWPTASAMAFMAGMWVFLTQIDKLILSRILSLEAFGYFSLAIAVAGGVLILTPPLNQVLQPRMIILAVQGRSDELQTLYHTATQSAAVALLVLGGGFALFAEPLLWVWTGNRMAATEVAPILFWYGLTNALIGLLVLPFMLQFAHGYLRLHVLGNLLLALTLLPCLIFASLQLGAIGAGRVLFIANLLFLLFWVPIVHRRLMPEVIWQWPLQDIFPIALTCFLVLWSASLILPAEAGRLITGLLIGMALFSSAVTGILAGNRTRALLREIMCRGKKG